MRITRPTGSDPLSRMLARIIERVEASDIVESPDIRPVHSPRGIALLLNQGTRAGGSANINVARFKISTIDAELIYAFKYTSLTEVEENATAIAKPFLLRWQDTPITRGDERIVFSLSDWQLRTITITLADSRTAEITEKVRPNYVVDDNILAVEVTEDETGIAGVEWIDLNVDGRSWQYPLVATEVCENHITKYAMFPRSRTFL